MIVDSLLIMREGRYLSIPQFEESDTMIWKMDGHDPKSGDPLPTLEIEGDSFDEALNKARKQNEWYCTGQVKERTK